MKQVYCLFILSLHIEFNSLGFFLNLQNSVFLRLKKVGCVYCIGKKKKDKGYFSQTPIKNKYIL